MNWYGILSQNDNKGIMNLDGFGSCEGGGASCWSEPADADETTLTSGCVVLRRAQPMYLPMPTNRWWETCPKQIPQSNWHFKKVRWYQMQRQMVKCIFWWQFMHTRQFTVSGRLSVRWLWIESAWTASLVTATLPRFAIGELTVWQFG